jgi:hypothetical protein
MHAQQTTKRNDAGNSLRLYDYKAQKGLTAARHK